MSDSVISQKYHYLLMTYSYCQRNIIKNFAIGSEGSCNGGIQCSYLIAAELRACAFRAERSLPHPSSQLISISGKTLVREGSLRLLAADKICNHFKNRFFSKPRFVHLFLFNDLLLVTKMKTWVRGGGMVVHSSPSDGLPVTSSKESGAIVYSKPKLTRKFFTHYSALIFPVKFPWDNFDIEKFFYIGISTHCNRPLHEILGIFYRCQNFPKTNSLKLLRL